MLSRRRIFALSYVTLTHAFLVAFILWLTTFCFIKTFITWKTLEAISISIESSSLILAIYAVVSARNQWVIDKENSQLERIVQCLKAFYEQYVEQLAGLRSAGDQSQDNFLRFKVNITVSYNRLIDALSDAYYIKFVEKQRIYDLAFTPIKAMNINNIEGFGDRLKNLITECQDLLREEK